MIVVYPQRGIGQNGPVVVPPPPAVRTEIVLQPGTHLTTEQYTARRRHMRAAGALATGMFSALSLIMFATGRNRVGYMMGVSAALAGAFLEFARIYGE